MKKIALLLGFLLVALRPSFIEARAAAAEKSVEQTVQAWLVLGPAAEPWPAFHDDAKRPYSLADLLRFEEFEPGALRPGAGAVQIGAGGASLVWREVKAGAAGLDIPAAAGLPSIIYLAVFVRAERWTKARLVLSAGPILQAFWDGNPVALKDRTDDQTAAGKNQPGAGSVAADLKIETGQHGLLLKIVAGGVLDPGRIKAAFVLAEQKNSPGLLLATSSAGPMSLRHLMDSPKPAGISISPDGSLIALANVRALPPGDETDSWIEIYESTPRSSAEEARLVRTIRAGAAGSWSPKGRKFTTTAFDRTGGTIWVHDLDGGTSLPVLKNVKNLETHVWAPDGGSLIYSVFEEGEKDSDVAKRFQTLEDRQPGWRNRSSLYQAAVPGGARRRLTAGALSTSLGSVSRDGHKLLFTRSLVDAARPFLKTELFCLDLDTLREDKVWSGPWFVAASWSPDADKILFLGGPSLFGPAGTNVDPGETPNEYDVQAYIYDLTTKRVDPITRDFAPSITQASWGPEKNRIRFLVVDGSFARLYEYDTDRRAFTPIETGVEAAGPVDFAAGIPAAALIGSGTAMPPRAFVVDFARRSVRLAAFPGRNAYADVQFGRVETWTFKSKGGRDIDGYVLLPPDFDPARKYPCIVNVYGGTTPIVRDFNERYPKSCYAALGYVVYVIQPSGAIGYGQSFSARHVNDWGALVADEVIEGVRKFLAAHPFVDPNRVGCLGASFGGFMTMLLTTKTNLFAAAIAHAGISSIAGYWGEGYWGYTYSAVASADSYPWNRKDIYVGQSPLFNADKIMTPLLLLHGAADTNVPPGESAQLFTALKILGREVEFIQFFDQNHHILTYGKRLLWTKTILAWFDRWLNGRPEWWSDLYPGR